MGLKEYNVMVGNTPTTMLLNDEDAERFGVTDADVVEAKAATTPVNKARTPRNKTK